MTRMNAALRRGSILLIGALVLGMIQAGPALAAPVAPNAPVDAPTTRWNGDDMVNGYDDADATDLLRAERQNAGDDTVLAASAPSDHRVNVAVVQPSGTLSGTDFITDAAITDMLAKVGASWKTQSNNQVQSVQLDGSVQRYTSAFPCSDPVGSWGEAAAKFGHSDRYFYSSPASMHLLVFVPSSCQASGLGSVGTNGVSVSANYGGVMWVSLKGGGDVETVTHEFGHNLGLNHSNSHQCPTATMSEGLADSSSNTGFSDGCADFSYGDYFDVMGITWSVGNLRPTALNVTHKVRLAAMSAGEMTTMSLPAGQTTAVQSFTLVSVGQNAGLRDIAVTDPRTGQLYYVDFRGGGGTDAGSLYETGQLSSSGAAIGVRVLTLRASGASIVLNSPKKSPSTGSKLYLLAGESLSTRSGGVKVSVNSIGGTANVTIKLAAAPSVTRLSGANRFATSAAISAANFEPGVPVLYLANGMNFPDALSGAPVAGKAGAPVLLVTTDSIPPEIQAEMTRLKPQRIVILGGLPSVSASNAAAVSSFTAGSVVRWSGANRFATSAAISAANFAPGVPVLYLANGMNFPDALSGAPVAGKAGAPVLLVTTDSIPPEIQAEMTRLKPQRIVILGGLPSVSANLATTINSYVSG